MAKPPKSSTRSTPDLRTRRLKTTHRLVLGVAGAPSAALLTLGIIVMATGSAARDVVLGILILGMAITVGVGVAVTSVLLRRETALARTQSEFVSRVSHDLRTPLTSIRMYVETLQLGRAADPAAARECLDALSVETDRLLAMVDRLLDWARIESARQMYSAGRAAVQDLIDAALLAFEPQRLQGEVTMQRDVPEGLPDVEVDKDAMINALVNLFQNAYHYTGEHKVIGVRAAVRDDRVEISVSDNGPGVAPSERTKIFERFYRGTAARSRRTPGTGLGLAIVRAALKAHRGTVRVEDNLPQGSVFTITLPVAEGPR